MNLFLEDVRRGLSEDDKSIPSKYLYDQRGSQLFDDICELDEYYLTRAELAILEHHAAEIALVLGKHCLLVEYGSGSSLKTRLLLDALDTPAGYVPIDISREHLLESAAALQKRYPGLEVLPVCADYDDPVDVPKPSAEAGATVVYFPGSTIGNFVPEDAQRFVDRIARSIGPRGGALIGFDLHKDSRRLEAAYDDGKGVSATFAKNLLVRMNRELGTNFDVEAFTYEAPYDPQRRRIEMRLRSGTDQSISLGGDVVEIARGETIRTEYSHKFTRDDVERIATQAGLRVAKVWTDPDALFSLQYLTLP